jgi:hypothetical protein
MDCAPPSPPPRMANSIFVKHENRAMRSSPLKGLKGEEATPATPSARVALLSQQAEFCVHRHQHAIKVVANLPVPAAKDSIPFGCQPSCATTIAGGDDWVVVLNAIDLDDETTFQANEVNDIGTDWVLSSKAQTVSAPLAQFTPHYSLFERLICAQTSSECVGHYFNFSCVTAERSCLQTSTGPTRCSPNRGPIGFGLLPLEGGGQRRRRASGRRREVGVALVPHVRMGKKGIEWN